MANPKEARRILDALPAQELKALDELSHWHESVSTAAGFKPAERLQLTGAIDEAAQPRLRKLSRDYFGATRPSRYQENLLWTQMHEYWRQAGLAWARSVDGFLQANDAEGWRPPRSRALRALAQQIKWQHLRYGPIDPKVWGVINNVFAAAEARGVADARIEFLKAAMFSASSPDGLLPAEIELAEKVVSELAGELRHRRRAGAASSSTGPTSRSRWRRCAWRSAPQPVPTPAALRPRRRRWRGCRRSSRGWRRRGRCRPTSTSPAPTAEAVLEVLRHLALYWAPEPPARQHPRHAVKSRLAIAHGFDGVVEALGGAGGGSLDFDAKGRGGELDRRQRQRRRHRRGGAADEGRLAARRRAARHAARRRRELGGGHGAPREPNQHAGGDASASRRCRARRRSPSSRCAAWASTSACCCLRRCSARARRRSRSRPGSTPAARTSRPRCRRQHHVFMPQGSLGERRRLRAGAVQGNGQRSLARKAEISATSSPHTECGIGYSCHSTW